MIQANSTGGILEVRRDIPSMRPYFLEEDLKEILTGTEEILRSGRLTLGKYAEQFEQEFAKYIGAKYAVAANSGTCTLEMICRAIDVRGKEVVTPTNTHIATSNAVLYAGGTPVLCDIDASSLCLNVEDAFSKITTKTRAIVVVHVGGLVHPRINEIRSRCTELGIDLIEDAAHAHGAQIDRKKAGTLSKAASFSFYPAKVITSVEGGMITTDDENVAQISKELRNHGNDSRGLQVRLGYNWRMSEIHSLIGLVQLRRIEEIIENKTKTASIYIDKLQDKKDIGLIRTPGNIRNSYYKFPVKLDKTVRIDYLQNALKQEYGIETGSLYYPPCHLQPIYLELFKGLPGTLPISEDVLRRTMTLPIYAEMNEDDARYVAEALLSVLERPEARNN